MYGHSGILSLMDMYRKVATGAGEEGRINSMRPMIELYLYGSCSSCRNAEVWLREHQADVSRRDFFRDRFSRDELADVLGRASLTPTVVLSTRSRAYRERGLAERAFTNDELLDLMVEEPTLLRRPIAIGAGGSVVGFNRAGLEQLLAAAPAQVSTTTGKE